MARKQTVPIRGFGQEGWVPDEQNVTRPVTEFSRGTRNVRYYRQTLATMNDVGVSQSTISADPGQFPAEVVYWAPFWGAQAHIYVFADGTARRYTRSDAWVQLAIGLDVGAPFYHTEIGPFFILTSLTNLPQQLEQSATTFVDMPGWPANYRAGIIENYKNALIAIDVQRDATEEAFLIKGSHPYGDGDTTWDWDFTDPSSLAFESLLQTDGQSLVGLQSVRDSMVIYAERQVWRMDGIGSPRFTKVFNDDGMLGRYGRASVAGEALVVGRRDVYLHNGVQKRSLSDNKFTEWLFRRINDDVPPRVVDHAARNEVWILFATGNSTDPNQALIWKRTLDAWTLIDLGSSPLRFAHEAPTLMSGATTWGDLEAAGTTWGDLGNAAWSDFEGVDPTEFYGATATEVLNLDTGNDNRYRAACLIENRRLDLDELLGTTGDRIKLIQRIFPQIYHNASSETDPVPVEWQVGTAPTVTGTLSWGPWRTFNANTDQHAVDFRQTGRYLALRFRPQPSALPYFETVGFDLELAVMGRQ